MKKFNNISKALTASMFVFALITPSSLLAAGPSAVNLGTAGDFTILSKTGISTTGSTSVTGDIGVSPISATAITGFGLILPAASPFSTSSLVTGKIYASDYTNPTPSNLTTAVSNMETAYTDAVGRAADVTELGAGNIGGLTIAPGVYKWGTGLIVPTNVTLSGTANDVWIFQIAQNLNVSSGVKIILSGGAQASNIFWAVAGQTTIGTTAVFNGNILDKTAIVLNTGATLNGRALAQTAVTLDSNAVTMPSYTAPVVVVTPPTPTYIPPTTTTPVPNNSPVPPITTSIVTPPPSVVVSSATYNFGTRTMSNGSNGSSVMEVQRFLNVKLNLGLIVDGKFGPKTTSAIKKWQSQNNLVSDGIVGAKTRASMYAKSQ